MSAPKRNNNRSKMDQEEKPHSSEQPSAKRPKMENESDQSSLGNEHDVNSVKVRVVDNFEAGGGVDDGLGLSTDARADVNAAGASTSITPSNVKQTAAILKLDIDCFEEAFDYLPMKDLISSGRTCKRMQQVAGYCFQQTYQQNKYDRRVVMKSQGIYTWDTLSKDWENVSHFAHFIEQITIYSDGLQHFSNVQSKFHRLKQIEMSNLDFTTIEIGELITRKTLSKLEALYVFSSILSENFHEIIDQCTKLRRLEVVCCDGEYNWFDRKYPTLEYLKLVSDETESIKGVSTFLELNPNIRKFATTAESLWEIRDNLVTSNIKLDHLVIKTNRLTMDKFKLTCEILNKLYERGVYRKLNIHLVNVRDQEEINQLTILNGLAKLFIFNSNHPIAISPLKNFDGLYVGDSKSVTDLEVLANDFINLRYIHFTFSSIDAIMPFIRRSVEMQQIKIEWLGDGAHFNKDTNIIDLMALNREREELMDAEKITLYVKEKIYLATKWAFGDTDFRLIRLKRIESFKLGIEFDL